MSNRDDRPEKMEDGSTAAPVEQPVTPVDPPVDPPAAPEPKADAPAASEPPAALGDDPEPPQGAPTVEEFEQHIQECNDDLEAIDQQMGELRRQRDQVEKDRDRLVMEKDRHFPPPNQAQALRAYLDQQQRNREERAQRLGKLVEAGLLTNKAPIDAVRSRATGYGRRAVEHPLIQPKNQG